MASCDYQTRRFSGLNRLYHDQACLFLQQQHVCVVGIGGVGSWVAEAFARSGVGRMTLIDLDHIAVSNVNRQIHALEATLGASKVETMAERLIQINPDLSVQCIDDFLTDDNVEDILIQLKKEKCTYIVDCIDQVKSKVALILEAKKQGIPLLVCGGSGGKKHIENLQVSDLAYVQQDALLSRVRQILRKEHQYPKGQPHRKPKKMGIQCVWIEEPSKQPEQWGQQAGVGSLSCAGYGSCVTVTSSMGMRAVNTVLNFWFS